ncbi:hypothetical protein [Amycolatopsis pigmentata]|uniref:Uncharacterized protein n=1 Tax=Amycolatopsis pigmentata TaxID=450801 RepID=A0ABW5G9X1_9PSEU
MDPRWLVQPLITPVRARDDGLPAQIRVGVIEVDGRERVGVEVTAPGPVGVSPELVEELNDHIGRMARIVVQRSQQQRSDRR